MAHSVKSDEGGMIIYKNCFERNGEKRIYYMTSLQCRDKEGKYCYLPINVELPRNTELNDCTRINLKKGFFTFFPSRAKMKPVPLSAIYLKVMEFEIIEDIKKGEGKKKVTRPMVDMNNEKMWL